MSSNLYVLLDGGLSFGVVVAICVWQLVSTRRAIRRRLEREKKDEG